MRIQDQLQCRLTFLVLAIWTSLLGAQEAPEETFGVLETPVHEKENTFFKIITLPAPENVLLEVGGMATFPDGRVALCTRRGDVFIIENQSMQDGALPKFKKFASGLHEALGMVYHQNALYIAQRGELTKLVDTNGDDVADRYETIYDWPLSGHYHEYSFGPKLMDDGSMMVTANVAFGDKEWWRGESRVPWRGWTMRITPEGEMFPWATGMRSPAGLGTFEGSLFYTDNQGDWMGSGGVWHVKEGSFTGHPAGLRWSQAANSPVALKQEDFFAAIDRRQVIIDGLYQRPMNIQDEENPNFLFAVKEQFPELQLPAVWLPHGILGVSNSEVLEVKKGTITPFEGQLLVGDQGQSKIMRVAMEKVKGEYQGVAFDFRSGFQSGVLRMTWGNDGSLYVGETNRGWGSAGTKNSGLERLLWTGVVPFEIQWVHAKPDGFEITFTKPVNKTVAKDLDNYSGRHFIYKYHPVYGSPTVNEGPLDIKGVKVSEDGLKVHIVVDNMKQYYVHRLRLKGIIAAEDGQPLLHHDAYYTLNNIPDGAKVALSELSTFRTSETLAAKKRQLAKAKAAKRIAHSKKKANTKKITYAEVEPLLTKNTCVACHQINARQIGPSFANIAKRNYSAERIVELIYNPEPENWPDFATPMAAMPQVPKDEALRIAQWINTLK
ncbi:MAG: c-type cytochrome [Bacteroidota bacterium]